jgi:hypothetical protein
MDSLVTILSELRLLDERHRALLREADEYYASDGVTRRPRYDSHDSHVKEWLRGKLRDLTLTDEQEYMKLKWVGPRMLTHSAWWTH